MKWGDLSFEQMSAVSRLAQSGKDIAPIVEKLGTTETSLKRYVRQFRFYLQKFEDAAFTQELVTIKDEMMGTHFEPPVFADSYDKRDYDDYMVLRADNAIVIGDLEIPDHDNYMLTAAYLLGVKYGIKTLLINGDFLATDQQALNDWAQVHAEREATLREVVDEGRSIFKMFLKWFDTIKVTSGNHDQRVAKKTRGQVTLDMLYTDIEGVEWSPYTYMYVETSEYPIWVAHPQNFSKHPSTLVKQLYNKTLYPPFDPDGQKCHIMISHVHTQERGTSEDGVRRVMSIGTCRNLKRTKYMNLAANKHSVWVQGIGIIRNGRPSVIFRDEIEEHLDEHLLEHLRDV